MTDPAVSRLCELLGIEKKTTFDDQVEVAVKDFQKNNNLGADGIVGSKTWLALFTQGKSGNINDSDFAWAGEYLGCEPKAIKAVTIVETAGRGGFIAPGKPQILFEGHHFYKYLGKNAPAIAKTYPTICYPSWTKKYYKGGLAEYSRFELARRINEDAAIKSISMGMFQIMGSNYKLCGCSSPLEMWKKACRDQVQQFIQGVEFIRNSGLAPYLAKKDWAGFALRYNGRNFKENQYDTKLEKAYKNGSHESLQ